MKKALRAMAVLAIAALWTTGAIAAVEWHYPLYLANGGYWRQRVRIEVRNDTDRDAFGHPVEVRIGRADGEADLVGAVAEAVRVCDGAGTEMLFRITAPGGVMIIKGPIPTGSVLTLPTECVAGGRATYYAYFDNPAAWGVPDFLHASPGVRNGDLELGTGDTPSGWQHGTGDEQHRTFWVAEDPHSGKRCLKTVVARGAEPTWIATRQHSIHVIGGAKYVVRAWVRAENVDGYAGWYIHVGNDDNPMIVNRVLDGGGGTYGWKEILVEFTAPAEANRASLGTVLWGTGTAWFDDVAVQSETASRLIATGARPERAEVRETGGDAEWYDDDPEDDIQWDYRVPVRVMNLSGESSSNVLVYVDIFPLRARCRGRLNVDSIRVKDGSSVMPYYRFQDSLVFEGNTPPRTVRTYYVYFSLDERIEPPATADYMAILRSRRNLVNNPDFGLGEKLPTNWEGDAEGERPADTIMGFDQPGVFGRRCVKLHIPHGSKPPWTGWRQSVSARPGKTYLYAAWVKCDDIQEGEVRIHAHYRNAAGELCESQKSAGAGSPIKGTKDWTLMYGVFWMPEDIASFQLHLTMNATGTLWHDGVILAEAEHCAVGNVEVPPDRRLSGLTAWPVNATVKVFREDVPPQETSQARISVARNEKEPLQIAVRSPKDLGEVRVEVDPPANAQGSELTGIEVGVVGYVPIDHTTAYYRHEGPEWHRRYPRTRGSSDGWPGMWPDPLLPRTTFDLKANTTQPIWVTVTVPKGSQAGDYVGRIRLVSAGKTLKELPFTVHVWDFTLPDETHLAAVYDVRLGPLWLAPGQTLEEVRRQLWRLMSEHRLCPDMIYPFPVIRYEDGNVTADFTQFDQAAAYYFDELKLPNTYTPWYFYLFGWAHPPKAAFGEKPYEGEYPYEGVDRSVLRPEFKRAYQACLKVYWDHMKDKGWDKRCVLYISDEPWYDSAPRVRGQMKALCDMIHEVDSEIPIYCSTWHHRPEWDGYLDVWGISHYGMVAPEKLAELRAAGDRLWFTTDGQMCTDTPYCAVERLLPHYCFKYGVEAYEFWGISWLTYNPFEFGWHPYIRQAGEPGKYTWVRYPNGDGYLAYPGWLVGYDGPVSSVRLEQAREGVEDYEYLYLLRYLVAKARAAGENHERAEMALQIADGLVDIPNAGGRCSTKVLANPDAVFEVKEAVARAIEGLSDPAVVGAP